MGPFLFAFVCFVLVSCDTEQVDDLKASPSPGTTLSKYNQFISSLTSEVPRGSGRIYVHSSGGAAGGIISEGQGYGLLAAATTAAIIGPTSASFSTVVNQAYSLFLGWKQMCIQSTSDQCQSPRYCTSGGSTYPCLPHWKFDDVMGSAIGTGSAPDGDEDAILGMIVLLKLTQTNKPAWWNEVAQWTFNSCKQFYDSSTAQGNTASDRIVKLGACWGGWDCQNPSYHAPYAYKAMRDWMTSYSGSSDSRYNWNALISTTYRILLANQCSNTGLVTNWYVPNKNDPSSVGTTSCSGSGTPAAEYGSEASRTIWRVAIDWIFTRDPNAKIFLSRLVRTAEQGWRTKTDLPKGCLVNSIHPGWTTSAFLYGPTLTSLILRDSTISTQQTSLNSACSSLYQQSMTAYYDGSWAMLSFMTLNGDLAKIKPLLTGAAPPPVAPTAPKPVPVTPRPVPVTPTAPKPVPVAAGSCTNVKYGGNPGDPYFVPLYAPSTAKAVSLKCPNGASYPCKYDSSWQRWTCSPTSSCPAPRQAIVDGTTCQLDVNVVQYRMDEEGGEAAMPVYGIVLIAVGVVVVVVALGAAGFLLMRRRQGEERV